MLVALVWMAVMVMGRLVVFCKGVPEMIPLFVLSTRLVGSPMALNCVGTLVGE